MKNLILVLLILTVCFLGANAQQKQSKPEEKSIVNKEFDENGNLIKYDSTFVWSWSGDSAFQFEFPENDFNFPDFGEMFSDSVFSHHFEFFSDSSFVFPFDFESSFNNNFFSKEFGQMQEELQRHLGELNLQQHQFETEEQQKSWQELMQKQQKEQQELLKKWKEE